jgi:hypothetical protein
MWYNDEMPIGYRKSSAFVSKIGIMRLKPSNVVMIGDPIYVTVLDSDLSFLPTISQGQAVSAEAMLSASSRSNLFLFEMGLNSGIFTGMLTTCQTCDTASTLKVQPGAVVKVLYSDPFEPTAANQVLETIVMATTASIVATPTTVAAGGDITLILTDKDRRASSSEVQISASKFPNPDGEYLRFTLQAMQQVGVGNFITDAKTFLIDPTASSEDGIYIGGVIIISEKTCDVVGYSGAPKKITVDCPPGFTPPESSLNVPYIMKQWGQFGGRCRTANRLDPGYYPSNSIVQGEYLGTISVEPGQGVEFVYDDNNPPVSIRAVTMISSVSNISGYPAFVLGRSVLVVELRNSNLDHNAQEAGNLTMQLSNQRTRELETLLVIETGADTGLFVSWIDVVHSPSPGENNDGILHGRPGDSVALSYNEATQALLSMHFAASVAIPAPNFPLGEPLSVTVSDGDLDRDRGSPDRAVGLASLHTYAGDVEPLTLLETGASTGVFTAACPTRRLLYVPGCTNGVLEADFGASVWLAYQESDPATLHNASSTARGLASASGTIAGPARSISDTGTASGASDPVLVLTVVEPELGSLPALQRNLSFTACSALGASDPNGAATALSGVKLSKFWPPGSGGGGREQGDATALSNLGIEVYRVRHPVYRVRHPVYRVRHSGSKFTG